MIAAASSSASADPEASLEATGSPQDPQRAAGRAGGYAGEDAAGRRPYCDGGEGVGIKKSSFISSMMRT